MIQRLFHLLALGDVLEERAEVHRNEGTSLIASFDVHHAMNSFETPSGAAATGRNS